MTKTSRRAARGTSIYDTAGSRQQDYNDNYEDEEDYVRSKNGARVINAQTFMIEQPALLGLLTKRVMQASGTGVRTRTEARDRALQQFDQEPVPSY